MPTIQAEQHCINESTTVTEVIEEPKLSIHTLNHSGAQSTCRRRFCEVYGTLLRTHFALTLSAMHAS